MARKKSVQKLLSPTINFSPKLQAELESLIEDSSKTKLEGVRAKVFQDRYSLKDADGKSLRWKKPQPKERSGPGVFTIH